MFKRAELDFKGHFLSNLFHHSSKPHAYRSQNSVIKKCHMGEWGENFQKKCDVLFEWPHKQEQRHEQNVGNSFTASGSSTFFSEGQKNPKLQHTSKKWTRE